MNELAQLIIAHTVIGMTKTLNEGDTVLCLCGESLEGFSAHAEHAKHLAEELTKAGYALPKKPVNVRKFDIGDRVETFHHYVGDVIGWTTPSTGRTQYTVHLPHGIYTYSEEELTMARKKKTVTPKFEVLDIVTVNFGVFKGTVGEVQRFFTTSSGVLMYDVEFRGGTYTYRENELTKKFRQKDRVRITAGRLRGHFGVVVKVFEFKEGMFYDVKVNGLVVSYSEKSLQAA